MMRFSDLSSQQQQYCTNLERMEKSSSTTQSPTIFIEEEKVNPTCSLPSPFSSEGASAPGNDDHGGFGGDAHPLAVFSSQSIIASSSSRSFESSIIPVGWEPGNWDVICQRGKECFEHVGNRRFRMCIENHLKTYLKLDNKQEKTLIVSTIVDNIRQSSIASGGYGFVKKELLTNRWVQVDDKVARDKVGQALRDLIKAAKKRTKRNPRVGGGASSLSSILSQQQHKRNEMMTTMMDQQNLFMESMSPDMQSQNQLEMTMQQQHILLPQVGGEGGNNNSVNSTLMTSMYGENTSIFSQFLDKSEGGCDEFQSSEEVSWNPVHQGYNANLDNSFGGLLEEQQQQHEQEVTMMKNNNALIFNTMGTQQSSTLNPQNDFMNSSSSSLMNPSVFDTGCDNLFSQPSSSSMLSSAEWNAFMADYCPAPAGRRSKQRSYASRSA